MRNQLFTKLLGIQGYRVRTMHLEMRKGQPSLIVELKRLGWGFECGQGHRSRRKSHSSWMMEIQPLTGWQYLTFLRVRHDRVNGPDCGVQGEVLPFVAEGARVTGALATLVAELCKVMTVKAVGILQGLHRGTVKTIDKLALKTQQALRPLQGITVLGIDEIVVGRGQHYGHMVSALDGPRGSERLFVGEGRKEKHWRKFWTWFGPERSARITHAVMDMWKPFDNSFRAHCATVKIIHDRFHVTQHLLDALNTVRKRELRKARKRFKGLLAGKKFILLSCQRHMRGKARATLNRLLAANRCLFKAPWLKESFGHLWTDSSKAWARKFFRQWTGQLKWSRLTPYRQFAQMVEKHWEGIEAYCGHPVSLGFIESANLKARHAIRMAYGFRDNDYMKLKIIQASTPWMREFQPWLSLHKNPS